MNAGRFARVAGLDLGHNARRPLVWIFLLILVLMSWGLSSGHVRIASGESVVGGTQAWLTSEFAISQMLSFLVILIYAFFIAVAAGMTVIQDDDLRVGSLLHSTPLTPSEYVYGKFAAVLGTFVALLALHVAFMAFFNHVVPNEAAKEMRGPFVLMNYLKPALLFGLPPIVFFAGTSLAIGTWTRKPILVFVLPVAVLVVCGFFLWEWSPSWLDPRVNRLLMAVDPAGFRWLNETWLKVDRGVKFYNSAPVGLDGVFLANRLVLLAVGLGGAWFARRRLAGDLRGEKVPRRQVEAVDLEALPAGAVAAEEPGEAPAISGFGMSARAPGLLAGAWTVARAELQELRHQPGLYLFVPLILLQVVGQAFLNTGAFDTPLLYTSGTLAVGVMNMITVLVCLLLLFYTVESLERERRSGFASMFHATPVRTGAILLGKTGANAFIAAVILAAAFVGCMIALAIQGHVPLDPWPFVLVWVVLLLPTFVVWTTFVMALQALLRNRYTTYAVALAALIFTGYRQGTNEMNWVGNWGLYSALHWSDLGLFELDRMAIVMNRVLYLGLAALFVAFTAKVFTRGDRDIARLGDRLRPSSLARGALALSPFMVVPLVAGVALYAMVASGFGGKAQEKAEKDYWRRNMATWRGAEYPALEDVKLDLTLDPPKRYLHSIGTFTLVNRQTDTLEQVPLTRGLHWKHMKWTMNGAPYTPEDRVGLEIFTPPRPLAPGDSMRVGFDFDSRFPTGISKNGGRTSEFILPSGAVLTSFTPSFVPVVGYMEDVGIDKDNKFDSKEYPADFYRGVTPPAFGGGNFVTTDIRITGPAAYTYNSVGVLESDSVRDGRRTVEWRSDHPVNFFNVVAGKWKERDGNRTAIYYAPAHPYNIGEMIEALNGARKYYSEWFMPFPWKRLKLSEFAAHATYAQGFPTDITFSEGIGFLTKSDPRANLAFMVTAHESAHQWWGNILLPGKGPGGNILSEGMAHFSTILLFDRMKGDRQRIEFCKRIESRYGDRRQVDSERPLVKIDGTKRGDVTVTYDKGGWVFWMLLNQMGRERCLEGLQDFIRRYERGPDHAVLQDFVRVMREHSADPAAFDAFVKQWFFEVVVPEYKLHDAKRTRTPGGWVATVDVENAGTGTMPVEIAAVRGERFPKEKPGHADAVTASTGGAAADSTAGARSYREARRTVVLGAGQKVRVTIPCSFEPQKIIVDPDAKVLQLKRKQAVAEL